VAVGQAQRRKLRGRIAPQHLRGNINGATLRRTLAAALRPTHELVVIAPGRLARDDEQQLSAWIMNHFCVGVHPFEDRDPLADLERRVLGRLAT
jgi:hypothetical protein